MSAGALDSQTIVDVKKRLIGRSRRLIWAEILLAELDVNGTPSIIIILRHLASALREESHVIMNDCCPFVFARKLYKLRVVPEEIACNVSRFSCRLGMHYQNSEVSLEGDKDGVEGFVKCGYEP